MPTSTLIAPTPTANKFSILEDSDGDDSDELEVYKALSVLTPNVQLASEKSRPQRAKKANSTLNIAHLNAVARMVKAREIDLPDVDLDDDEDYYSVWAMVDSGAGANVARRSQIPGSRESRSAPRISLTIANGETLRNRGARIATCFHKSGSQCERTFYDAPVEMPILSVTEISKEGRSGSEVRFRAKDGVIIDNATGRTTPFVKRMGVYFMRLYFRKNAGDPQHPEDFHRLDR